MRRLLLVALALGVVPSVAAGEPYVVLLDWQEGHALVGTTSLVMSPLAPSFAFDVDACHRTLLLDLLYDPQEVGAQQGGVGSAYIDYDWLVQLAQDEAIITQARVRNSGYGFPLGTVEQPGAYEIRISLANGANVSWEVRVRAREVPGELACEPRIVMNEVESNPAGLDAGNEWIELYNAGNEAADLSLWTLRATHGTPSELVMPDGIWLDPGARIVITFDSGQALDNTDEQVELLDAFGRLRDTTPVLSDSHNDTRTWQRAGDGGDAWQFASATMGTPNVA